MPTAHVNVKGRTSMDGSGWAAGLRKMETGTKGAAARMAGSFAGAIGGVFAIGFLTSATRRIVQHADQIHKTAIRIGTSTETIQKFDFAATQSGASMGDVEKAFFNTGKAIESAKQGLTTHIRAFQAFGISMQMLGTMSPEQVFLKIAEAIEKAGGAMDKAKSLQDIMGRGGKALIPAFTGGFTGLADSAPKGIDSATIDSLVQFNDELDRLKREALPLAAEAVKVLADVFSTAVGDRNEDELDFASKAGMALLLSLSGEEGMKALRKTKVQRQLGVDVSQDEWDKLSEEHGRPDLLAKEERTKKKEAAYDIFYPDEVKKKVEETTKSWSKPSMQLNSLQRIGAAVTQSADPIAIEKNNNKLLQTIAKNTKKTADNTADNDL
jgi:hypothetical protein